MKHLLVSWVAAMVLAGLLAGCRPELDFVLDSFETSGAQLSGPAEAPSLLFSSDEGEATVVFHSTGRWQAAFVNGRATDWCSMSESEGRGGTVTLLVKVRANHDYDERSASLVITCDELQRTLVVTQKQKDALILNSNLVRMGQGGGDFSLAVETNVGFQAVVEEAASSWIVPVPTKGLVKQEVGFTVLPNETPDSREGRIALSSSLGKETVTVYQEGEKRTLILGFHDIELLAEGGSFYVNVTSNLNVTHALQDGSWVHEVESKTFSTNTFYFPVDRNHGRTGRRDVVVFRDETRGISDSLRIVQHYEPILHENQDKVTVPDRSVLLPLLTCGGTPDDFSVSIATPWMGLAEMVEDTNGCRILVKTAPNRSEESRKGEVRVYRKDFDEPDIVTVTQAGKQAYFSFTTSSAEVSAPDFAQRGEGFILWGDGSFDVFDRLASRKKSLVHRYTDGLDAHTVVVESGAIPWLLAAPEDGMHLDFTTLKKKE